MYLSKSWLSRACFLGSDLHVLLPLLCIASNFGQHIRGASGKNNLLYLPRLARLVRYFETRIVILLPGRDPDVGELDGLIIVLYPLPRNLSELFWILMVTSGHCMHVSD